MTKLISIISPPYSGSTLLAFLIAAHPEVATIGERKKFCSKMVATDIKGTPLCSCGTTFQNCEFWKAVKSRAFPLIPENIRRRDFSAFHLYSNLRFNRIARRICLEFCVRHMTHLLPYPLKQRLAEVIRANATLIDAILTVGQRTIFLDSSKSLTQTLFLDTLPNIDTYILHLIRDGRGQVNSTLKHHADVSTVEASGKWVAQVKKQKRLLQRWKGKALTVQYERLCAIPQVVVDEINDFIGLPGDINISDLSQRTQHIMGNPMRLEKIDTIQDMKEWKSDLTPSQLSLFEQTAGDFNRKLGYHD